MRKLILLAIFLTVTLSAGAEKRLSVAQFEHALIKARIAHKSDAALLLRIGTTKLSERLSKARRDRLVKDLRLDVRVAQALHLLADRSAFLAPPASDLPDIPPPGIAAQQRMLDAARNYVAQTLPRLPNFLATRTTEQFDDSPQVLSRNAWPLRAGLHLVGKSSVEISVLNDRGAMSSAPVQDSKHENPQGGLTSWGEFGPILGMIVEDTANGKIAWSRWEKSATTLVAVFHYSVLRSSSHFQVNGFLPQPFGQVGPTSVNSVGGNFELKSVLDAPRTAPYHITPGYHGEIWLDPATGTILRITIEADLKGQDPVTRADTLVEYSPVSIGGQSFVCPVRSITIHMDSLDPNNASEPTPLLQLNEIRFTHYHRFGTTMRILLDPAAPE